MEQDKKLEYKAGDGPKFGAKTAPKWYTTTAQLMWVVTCGKHLPTNDGLLLLYGLVLAEYVPARLVPLIFSSRPPKSEATNINGLKSPRPPPTPCSWKAKDGLQMDEIGTGVESAYPGTNARHMQKKKKCPETQKAMDPGPVGGVGSGSEYQWRIGGLGDPGEDDRSYVVCTYVLWMDVYCPKRREWGFAFIIIPAYKHCCI